MAAPATPPTPATWNAPHATTAVDATVTVPGSKSLSNRYLVLAALATGTCSVDGLLHSRDTALMMSALTALGATITTQGSRATLTPIGLGEPADSAGDYPRAGAARPDATGSHPDIAATQPDATTSQPAAAAAGATSHTAGDPAHHDPVQIECGLAGTVMRFVPPLAAALGLPATFDGDPGARSRPMGTVLDALAQLGARVDSPTGGLPFTVLPRPLSTRALTLNSQHTSVPTGAGAHVAIDASASSQFVSGLLLAGCALPAGLDLVHTGSGLPSRPHIDMTVQVLRECGVTVTEPTDHRWCVAPGRPAGFHTAVEPDLSNAATFLAAALVTGGALTVPHWPQHTTQAGDAIREIARAFGGDYRLDAAGLTVTGPATLAPVDLDLSAVGELTPVVAAIAACAPGRSRLRGIGHLRGHETDRLAALARELTGLGAEVTESADALTIESGPVHGGLWHTYADHRMVMAGAVIGLHVAGTVIEDPATVGKTLPDFVELWQQAVTESR